MNKTVTEFVKKWTVFQQARPDRSKYPGLLQPLPVPDFAWQVVSMDFIEGLPRSGRYNCILVVVDKFSRFAHFIPLAHPFSAATVAMAFMDNVYKLHAPLNRLFPTEIKSSTACSGKTFLLTLEQLWL
jgi:hypothetical protein